MRTHGKKFRAAADRIGATAASGASGVGARQATAHGDAAPWGLLRCSRLLCVRHSA